MSDILKAYARDRVGLFFGVILIGFLIVALTAQWITPADPFETNLSQGLQAPSAAHWLGTDQFGRDTLSRVILATQVTARIVTVSLLFSLLIGVPIGMMVGFAGGLADAVVMRITDMLLIFPTIMIAIIIVVIVGPSEYGVVIALGLSQLPNFIRIARSAALSVRRELYVEAAVAAGASWPDILLRHVLHNISGPIIVKSTLALPGFVLGASSLSYLGLGVQPPTPEWGQMLHEAKDFLTSAPYLIIGPAIALSLFVLSANMAGDSLNESIDPKLKSRRFRPSLARPATGRIFGRLFGAPRLRRTAEP
jgi:ABC-type dipeptide/oligopeptide/nickel transport system permease subunit